MASNEAIIEVINPWHLDVEEVQKGQSNLSYPGSAFDINVTPLTKYRSI